MTDQSRPANAQLLEYLAGPVTIFIRSRFGNHPFTKARLSIDINQTQPVVLTQAIDALANQPDQRASVKAGEKHNRFVDTPLGRVDPNPGLTPVGSQGMGGLVEAR